MTWMPWMAGAAIVLFAGAVSYFVTRRYGLTAAVAVPAVALAAMVGMTWQERGLDMAGGLDLVREALVLAGPVLGGVLVGILLAWRRG